MKICIRFIVPVLIIFSTLTTHAQQTVYFTKDTSSVKKKHHRSSETNIVKIAPLSFLFGLVPVFYERRISDIFSVQVGAGITIKNYMKEITDDLELGKADEEDFTYNWNNGQGSVTNFGSDDSKNTYKTGTFFSIQPRIYFEGEAMDGWYMGLSYENTTYKFGSPTIVTGVSYSNPVAFTSTYSKDYNKYSDIAVHFGGQSIYDRLSLEYSFGIAIRSKKSRQYVYGFDSNNSNYIDGYADLKKSVPVGLFSFRVGYHF